MPTLIERTTAELDTLTDEMETVLQRSVDENRDPTDEERTQVEALNVRRSGLQDAIDAEAALVERRAKVTARLAGLPTAPTVHRADSTREPEDPDKVLLRDFPSPGHYAAAFHAATSKGDKAAAQLIERATAHQTTTDNPGLIPRPIIGPVINRLVKMRPLIESVGVREATAPKFDRPKVTQHVDVDVQPNEKDLTASRKMLVGNVPVTLVTYAGHLNLSKQDIRWSTPNLLDLVYDDFALIYARRTDKGACTDFVAAVTQTQAVADWTPASLDAALGAAGSTVEGADGDNGEFNHIWMSRNVAVKLGGARNPTTSLKLYNIPIVGGTAGDLDGIPVTIDPRLAPGTMIGGDISLVEYWEDLEGFLSVDEPNVLGQMVGYAGYGALAVVDPTAFVKFTIPVLPLEAEGSGNP